MDDNGAGKGTGFEGNIIGNHFSMKSLKSNHTIPAGLNAGDEHALVSFFLKSDMIDNESQTGTGNYCQPDKKGRMGDSPPIMEDEEGKL